MVDLMEILIAADQKKCGFVSGDFVISRMKHAIIPLNCGI